jgi:hypothetical protein
MGYRCWNLILASLAVLAEQAGAREPVWFTDYSAARREAVVRNKPLFLDLGSQQCFWCRKLETITLQDPFVAELLCQHFVSVKVDGHREGGLTSALQVSSFPTLIVAAPDGRILERHEGFLGATELRRLLESALGKLGVSVGPVVPIPQPEQVGSSAQSPPRAETKRREHAERLLAEAQEDLAAGFPLACLERCRKLTSEFADCPAAETARSLQRQLTCQDAWPHRLQGALLDHLADLYWEQSQSLLAQERYAEAAPLLDFVARLQPQSPRSQAAHLELLRLQKLLAQRRAAPDHLRGQSP